jgi:hypothetical protein
VKTSADTPRSRTKTIAWAAGAAVLAAAVGAAPGLAFWLAVRHADGTYPNGSEALVLVAAPALAGAVFAALSPRPVWKRSLVFTALYGILPALLTILAIYGDKASGLTVRGNEAAPLITGPLGVMAAWLLCWFLGALAAGLTSRARNWRAQGGTLQEWASTWWARRRCHHDWELEKTVQIPGRVGHLRYAGEVGHHDLRYFRCKNCGATRTQSDRWGPIADRRQ